MKIIADLHVHSKYSRATAKDLVLENLYEIAQLKGIQMVATGDFSHPAWFDEIQTKLEAAEPGLLRLKPEAAKALDERVPPICRGPVRFILATEISNVYKKSGRTRKNHNLVFVPHIEAARDLNRRLERIGNIHSDGRPILGLDARDLLEVVLEICADAFLVPAHIWTPWFSVLGSKSGFDSIAECFGDLSSHVFAAETGLSSDPAMNWRVSSLDEITLISNSDAHSPGNLGREANVFDIELQFLALRDALKSADPARFLGTIEFYPEEGKYHMDGHRSCEICFEPKQTMEHQGLCPRCGKALTVGVLSRVEELADRPAGLKPARARPYRNLIPLAGILSEVLQAGPKSQKVMQAYRTAIEKLGPEFAILDQLDGPQIEAAGIPLLAEAIGRMRSKKIDIRPGFDGEYGTVQIFSSRERARICGQQALFAMPADFEPPSERRQPAAAPKRPAPDAGLSQSDGDDPGPQLNADQRQAVLHPAARLMIVAGPGTGKTHTLTCRIGRLIAAGQADPRSILALTFTHKAAEEMRTRLQAMLGADRPLPLIATFHALCLRLLKESDPDKPPVVVDEEEQAALIVEAAERAAESGIAISLKPQDLRERIMRAKQSLLSPAGPSASGPSPPGDQGFGAAYRAYQHLLDSQGLLDFEDLIFKLVQRLETDSGYRQACRDRFRHLFVDEYQDLNHGQYRLIRALAPTRSSGGSLCVIGDPDQSIYGFRGSDAGYFIRFAEDYPDAGVVRLVRNYRSTETILCASHQIISAGGGERIRTYSGIEGVRTVGILELPNEHAEAECIARMIESLVGGSGYHSVDTGRVGEHPDAGQLGYADFAVLMRTSGQMPVMADAFKKGGIPFQAASRRQLLRRRGVVELVSLLRLIAGLGGYADAARGAAVLAPALAKNVMQAFREWGLNNRLAVKDGLSAALRFPIPGLSRSRQLQLGDFVGRVSDLAAGTARLKASEAILRLKELPGIAQRLADEESQEAVRFLWDRAERSGVDLKGFLERLTLQNDTDLYHPRAEKTALMTMHAAKGLEFEVVFIAGCETGLIPFQRRERESGDPDEERRLFYVAVTRARRMLYLTRAQRRRAFGRTEDRDLSVFVKDIEAGLLREESPGGKRRKPHPDQLQLF